MTVDVTGWCLQGERNVFHAVVQDRSIVWWDGALMRDRARGSKREPPGSRDRCQRDLPCIVWVCEGVSDVTRDRSKVYHFRALFGRVTYNEPNREPPSSSWKVAAYIAVQVCASRFSEL